MIDEREPRLAAVPGRALAARSAVSATTSSNPPQQRFVKIDLANWAFTKFCFREPDTSVFRYFDERGFVSVGI